MQEKNLLFSLEVLGGFVGLVVVLATLTVAMPFALVYSLFSGDSWDSFLTRVTGLGEIAIDL